MGLPGLSGRAAWRFRASLGSAAAVALTFVFALLAAPELSAADVAENAFDSIIMKASARYAVDPLLVKAVISSESQFRPRATGASGEMGLMQLKWGAVKDWADAAQRPLPSAAQVYDPYLNIEIGTWFLARALQRWDGRSQCYTLALCEYNAGRSRAVSWHQRTAKDSDIAIASAKTQRYVAKVRDKYIEYSAINAASLAGNIPVDGDKQSLRAIQQ